MILPSKEFLQHFKDTVGALSVCESIAIMNIAAMCPPGNFIELGGHRCKSSMSAIYGGLNNGTFTIVDTNYANPEEDKIVAGILSKAIQLTPHPLNLNIKLVGDLTVNELPKHKTFSYIFSDTGDHDQIVFDEIALFEHKVISGGIVCFHDVDNQFHSPRQAIQYLVNTGNFEEIIIDWKPIFDYVRENDLEKDNNSWHERGSEEFPKFVGAVKRK